MKRSTTIVNVRFRSSGNDSQGGSLFYQVIHNNEARQFRTGFHIHDREWDKKQSRIVIPECESDRKYYLIKVSETIRSGTHRLNCIIKDFDKSGKDYSAKDIIDLFKQCPTNGFIMYMSELISELKGLGKIRTSETYTTAMNSFKHFYGAADIALEDINSDLMQRYESYLKRKGLCPNSTSFHMRILRATYNRAVQNELVLQKYPFRHVYTGVEKTIKRAVPLKIIRQIKELDLSKKKRLQLAKDIFMFSFYTRGMSFIDMAFLKKSDLRCGILTYRRHKTGKIMHVKWEKCMQDIVDGYRDMDSEYLLPIIRPDSHFEKRKQYIYSSHNINRSLQEIGCRLNLSMPLTMYVSRHTWASIAKSRNVPVSVICDAMGHDSESTTRIYLTTLDTLAIDKVNRMILKLL